MTIAAQMARVQMPDPETAWAAVLKRDPQCDGTFVYAVSSTGVYCRPSCGSRRPRRDRVSFFAGAAEAEAAGYRACLRCGKENDAAGRVCGAVPAVALRTPASPKPIPEGGPKLRTGG